MANIYPQSVLLEITNKCNFSCIHCYANAGINDNELDINQLKDLIIQLKNLGVKNIAISGGEPFLYPHLWNLISFIKKYNIKVIIDTNGSLINTENMYNLKIHDVDLINISLHGYNDIEHELLTNKKGSFDKTIESIEIMHTNRIPFGFNVCINRFNFETCHKILYIAYYFGAKSVNYFKIFPTGKGKISYTPLSISINEHKEVFKRIKDLIEKLDLKHLKLYAEVPYIYKNAPWDRAYACGISSNSFVITSDGNVYLCNGLRFPELLCGNINEQKLDDIWEKSIIFNKVRATRNNQLLLDGHCSSCDYFSFCMGGCRACSYNVYQDIYHSDDNCWLVRK